MRITFPEPLVGSIERSDHTARQDLEGVGGEGETNDSFLRILLLKLTCLNATYSPAIFFYSSKHFYRFTCI
jgi:hypothetical protein